MPPVAGSGVGGRGRRGLRRGHNARGPRGRHFLPALATPARPMAAPPRIPADLTTEQRTSLAEIAVTNNALYRAICSKSNCAKSFGPKAEPGGNCWPDGCRGRHTRASPSSSTSPQHPPLPRPDREHARPRAVQRPIRSHQHFICGHLPSTPTDSTAPTHKSPWPCSPKAASAPNYPGAPHETWPHPETATRSSNLLHHDYEISIVGVGSNAVAQRGNE